MPISAYVTVYLSSVRLPRSYPWKEQICDDDDDDDDDDNVDAYLPASQPVTSSLSKMHIHNH